MRKRRGGYDHPDVPEGYFMLSEDGTLYGDVFPPDDPPPPTSWKCGLLFRIGSMWIGYHWSRKNRRICINLIPIVTFWITLPGGNVP
jgi:hypothetical protein